MLMKKALFFVASCLVVLAFVVASIVSYDNVKAKEVNTQISQVQKAQAELKLHDAVNATALQNASDQIVKVTGEKNTLCVKIKAAKLTDPLCP